MESQLTILLPVAAVWLTAGVVADASPAAQHPHAASAYRMVARPGPQPALRSPRPCSAADCCSAGTGRSTGPPPGCTAGRRPGARGDVSARYGGSAGCGPARARSPCRARHPRAARAARRGGPSADRAAATGRPPWPRCRRWSPPPDRPRTAAGVTGPAITVRCARGDRHRGTARAAAQPLAERAASPPSRCQRGRLALCT